MVDVRNHCPNLGVEIVTGLSRDPETQQQERQQD